MTERQRKHLLEQADAMARSRAKLWRVFYARTKTVGVRYVEAMSEARAISRVRGAYAARPVLPSSEWDAIYRELGLRA